MAAVVRRLACPAAPFAATPPTPMALPLPGLCTSPCVKGWWAVVGSKAGVRRAERVGGRVDGRIGQQ